METINIFRGIKLFSALNILDYQLTKQLMTDTCLRRNDEGKGRTDSG